MPLDRITVENLMDSPIFVEKTDNILTVIKRLLQTRQGYVLVEHNGETVGIISDRDIQRLILKEGGMFSPSVKAKDFMVKPVVMVVKTTSLSEAEAIMQRKHINRLPVVEEENSKKVIGIINFETVHSNLLSSFAKSWTMQKRKYLKK